MAHLTDLTIERLAKQAGLIGPFGQREIAHTENLQAFLNLALQAMPSQSAANVSSSSQREMEELREAVEVIPAEAPLHASEDVLEERRQAAAWLRWYFGRETRASEAISNGDHWDPHFLARSFQDQQRHR